MTKYVTRQQAAATAQTRYEDVTTDIGTFQIRSVSESERADIDATMVKPSGKVSPQGKRLYKARWIARCVCDGQGARMYTDSQSDLGEILKMDAKITNQLADGIFDHCGVTEEDLEDMEKNFEPEANGD